MVAEVRGIDCPKDEWTSLSIGKAKVLAVVRDVGVGLVFVGSAKPAAGPPRQDYLTLSQAHPVSLQFEGTDNNVYVWPNSETLVVEVVRE